MKKIEDLLDRIADAVQEKIIDALMSLETFFRIDTAAGYWLDRIGERFFLTRSGDATLGTDAKYRRYIKAKAGQYVTDGSLDDFNRIFNASIQSNGGYIDNGNMSINVTIPENITDAEANYIIDNGILPKPAAVNFGIVYLGSDVVKFGFNGNGAGFNQASFGRTKVVGA